jgi:DNA-binding FrmR family transcriptional regulator
VAVCCNQYQDDQDDPKGSPPNGEDKIMATVNNSHVLEDQEQLDAVIKRMKRAQGQIAAVVRMLEEGRSCEEVVHQMAAVGKAVNTAAFTLISASLKECLLEDGRNRVETTEKLQKLFLSLA